MYSHTYILQAYREPSYGSSYPKTLSKNHVLSKSIVVFYKKTYLINEIL